MDFVISLTSNHVRISFTYTLTIDSLNSKSHFLQGRWEGPLLIGEVYAYLSSKRNVSFLLQRYYSQVLLRQGNLEI